MQRATILLPLHSNWNESSYMDIINGHSLQRHRFFILLYTTQNKTKEEYKYCYPSTNRVQRSNLMLKIGQVLHPVPCTGYMYRTSWRPCSFQSIAIYEKKAANFVSSKPRKRMKNREREKDANKLYYLV